MKKQTWAETQVQTLALPLISCVILDYLINVLSLNSLICKIGTLIPSLWCYCVSQRDCMQSDLHSASHNVSIQETLPVEFRI